MMASGRIRHSLGQIWSSLRQGWDPFRIESFLWEVLKPLWEGGRCGVGSLVAAFHLLSMRQLPQQVGLSPEKVTVGSCELSFNQEMPSYEVRSLQ